MIHNPLAEEDPAYVPLKEGNQVLNWRGNQTGMCCSVWVFQEELFVPVQAHPVSLFLVQFQEHDVTDTVFICFGAD